MATVAGSNFVSTSSRVNYGSVTSGSEAKSSTDEKWETRSKTFKSGNARTSRTIVCRSGMNLIFVGTEVGPWSKTGGPGDVLGEFFFFFLQTLSNNWGL